MQPEQLREEEKLLLLMKGTVSMKLESDTARKSVAEAIEDTMAKIVAMRIWEIF